MSWSFFLRISTSSDVYQRRGDRFSFVAPPSSDAAEAKMLSVFKSMDTDGSGTVEVKELRDFISSSAVNIYRRLIPQEVPFLEHLTQVFEIAPIDVGLALFVRAVMTNSSRGSFSFTCKYAKLNV